jgi:GrpB-like predicted nucleotidyltransferase (UPF0157 family)
MLLVGKHQRNPREGDYELIAEMFERLPKIAKEASLGGLTRFVGFESSSGEDGGIRFFGMEMEAVEDLPEDLSAWELDDSTWRISQFRDGRRETICQEEIYWRWRTKAENGPKSFLGEFDAFGPEEWSVGREGGMQRFSLFAHSPFDLRKSAIDDEIHLADYDPAWPERFEEMADWLRERLGPKVALRIEHYGSTAIPDIPAKPIIDILIEIPSFDEARRCAFEKLGDETWEFWKYDGHLVFIKRVCPMGRRTHHLHLAPAGHKIWNGLAFRDYLKAHPDDAKRYAALKYRLADAHRNDRERYTQAKTEFVEEISRR